MKRLFNYRSQLDRVIKETLAQPLVWGTHDCLIFVGKCVEAQTGVNLYAEHVGKYTDEDGAWAYLESLGYSTMQTFLEHYLEPIHISRAVVGDVVVVSKFNACAIILGERIGFLSSKGFSTLPLSSVLDQKAYRVG